MMAIGELDALDALDAFLMRNSGVTGKTVMACLNRESDVLKTKFFQPYQSKSDPFFRAASVITAPLAFCVTTLEIAAYSLYKCLKALADLVMLNPRQAFTDLATAGLSALLAVVAVVAVITSPVINAVDLIGSGVTTLLQNSDDEEQEAHTHDVFPA